MKKLKFIIPLVAVMATAALVIGTSAFHKKEKNVDPVLYWYESPYGAGDFKGTSTTVQGREMATGCDGETIECQKAFLEEALVNPANPNLGVDDDFLDDYEAIIYEHETGQ